MTSDNNNFINGQDHFHGLLMDWSCNNILPIHSTSNKIFDSRAELKVERSLKILKLHQENLEAVFLFNLSKQNSDEEDITSICIILCG